MGIQKSAEPFIEGKDIVGVHIAEIQDMYGVDDVISLPVGIQKNISIASGVEMKVRYRVRLQSWMPGKITDRHRMLCNIQ